MLSGRCIFVDDEFCISAGLPLSADRRQRNAIDPLIVVCRLVSQCKKNRRKRPVFAPGADQFLIVARCEPDIWLVRIGKGFKKASHHMIAVFCANGFRSFYIHNDPQWEIILRPQPDCKLGTRAPHLGRNISVIPESQTCSSGNIILKILFPIMYCPDMHTVCTSYVRSDFYVWGVLLQQIQWSLLIH